MPKDDPFADVIQSAEPNIDPMFRRMRWQKQMSSPPPQHMDTDPHIIERDGPRRSFRIRGMIEDGKLYKPGEK